MDEHSLGYATWSLGIFTAIACWYAQYIGVRVGSTDFGSMVWWPVIIHLTFMPITIIWTFCMVIYFRKMGHTSNKLASNLAALVSLLTAVFWVAAFLLIFNVGLDDTPTRYLQAQMTLGMGGITLGFSLLLAGILYMMRSGGSKALSVLTGITFLLTGGFGVLVGVSSGLSAIPLFTIYDIPWIPVVALVSSIMGIIFNLKRPKWELI